MLASGLVVAGYAQTSGKAEFEVASIKTNAPQPGFHFAADAASGGPGTADPGMFRCSKCSLATLIVKAFNLQPYQFPGRTSLADNTYDIQAKIPTGATAEEFSAMLQNLLKDRFGLTWHFQEKKMKGYHLVVAKNGPKLKESTGAPVPARPISTGPGKPNLTTTAVWSSLARRPATAPPTKPPPISRASFPIKSVCRSMTKPAFRVSTIFPCAGPALRRHTPAIIPTMPSPADTPVTMARAAPRPARQVIRPVPRSSTRSSNNSA